MTVSDRYDNHGTFTTTFTGEVTPAFTGGSGAVLTGHLALWNGGSFDKQNMVMHATTDFQGTDQNGNPVLFHAVDHASTSAAGVPNRVFRPFWVPDLRGGLKVAGSWSRSRSVGGWGLLCNASSG